MKAKLKQEKNYDKYREKHKRKIFEDMCKFYAIKQKDKKDYFKVCENDDSFVKNYLNELEEIQRVQKGILMIKHYLNIDEILENDGFNPDLSKAIQTPKNAAHNILTFPDSYFENLKKFAK